MKTVIFDFDMTLVNSIYAITRGLNKMADHFGLTPVDENDTRRVMSLESREFWINLWGEYNPEWNDYFVEEVADREKHYLEITPGTVELLEKVKKADMNLALATNRDNAWAALTSIDLAHYFDTAVGSGDVPRGKPAPDMINLILDQLKADPGKTIMVGDSPYDMQAAVAAGVRAVGVLEGGNTRRDLMEAGAWQVRDTLRDINGILGLPG